MTTPDLVSALIRAVSFVALLQAAGAMLFLAIFGNGLSASRPLIERLGRMSVLAGVVGLTLHYGLEAARVAGDWSGVADMELQAQVWQSSASTVWMLRLLALLLMAIGMRAGATRVVIGLCGATLATVSFTLIGHTVAAGLALSAVLAIHVATAAFWFGALLPLIAVAYLEPLDLVARIVATFSRLATSLVAALFAAGVVLMFNLLPDWSALTTSYGRLILAKLAVFVILMGLALLKRWRYVPALVEQPSARHAFQRTLLVEYLLIAIALVLTAVLTGFYSPEQAQ